MRWLRQAIACFVVGFSVSCCGVFSPRNGKAESPFSRPLIEMFVYISDDFPEAERQGIIEGVKLWEEGLKGHLVWHEISHFDDDARTPVPGGKWEDGTQQRVVVFKRISGKTAQVKKWDEEQKKNLVGLCAGDSLKVASAWIMYDRIHDPRLFRVVASHEFGHALGIGHVADVNSTMSEYLTSVDNEKLTRHDMKAFCEAYDLIPCDFLRRK